MVRLFATLIKVEGVRVTAFKCVSQIVLLLLQTFVIHTCCLIWMLLGTMMLNKNYVFVKCTPSEVKRSGLAVGLLGQC